MLLTRSMLSRLLLGHVLAILFTFSAAETAHDASSAHDAPTPPARLLRGGSQAIECSEDWGKHWCENNGCYWDTDMRKCSDSIADFPSDPPFECRGDWGKKWCKKNGCYWDTDMRTCSDPIANPPSSSDPPSSKSIANPIAIIICRFLTSETVKRLSIPGTFASFGSAFGRDFGSAFGVSYRRLWVLWLWWIQLQISQL